MCVWEIGSVCVCGLCVGEQVCVSVNGYTYTCLNIYICIYIYIHIYIYIYNMYTIYNVRVLVRVRGRMRVDMCI